jgi:DNA-binding NarL/FixJ family response regulator
LARLDLAELEVLGMLADGHRAAAVAEHLSAPPQAVRAMIRGILIAIEVRTQLEAVVMWHIYTRNTPRPSGISD